MYWCMPCIHALLLEPIPYSGVSSMTVAIHAKVGLLHTSACDNNYMALGEGIRLEPSSGFFDA